MNQEYFQNKKPKKIINTSEIIDVELEKMGRMIWENKKETDFKIQPGVVEELFSDKKNPPAN